MNKSLGQKFTELKASNLAKVNAMKAKENARKEKVNARKEKVNA